MMSLLLSITTVGSTSTPPFRTPSAVRDCCGDQVFKVALPTQSYYPMLQYHRPTQTYSGYMIDILDELKLETRAQINTISLNPHEVLPGLVTGAVSMYPIPSSYELDPDELAKDPKVAFLVPNYEHLTVDVFSGRARVMLKKVSRGSETFAFMSPFSDGLWCMILGCVLATGLVILFIEVVYPYAAGTTVSVSVGGVIKLWYHAAALLQAQDDFEWITAPMRVLRLGVVFAGLIFTGSYTANLAAFLSQPQYEILGPTTLADLRTATVCSIGFSVYDLEGWVGKVYLDDPGTPLCYCAQSNYTTIEPCFGTACSPDYDALTRRCHSLLDAGIVDAVVGVEAPLNAYIRNHCDKAVLSDYRFGSLRLGISVPDLLDPSWAAAARNNLSIAINHIIKSPVCQEIEIRNFGLPACTDLSNSNSDTPTLTIHEMSGLFIVLAVFWGISILIAVVGKGVRWRQEAMKPELTRHRSHAHDHMAMLTDAEMLRKIFELVKGMNPTEPSSAVAPPGKSSSISWTNPERSHSLEKPAAENV